MIVDLIGFRNRKTCCTLRAALAYKCPESTPASASDECTARRIRRRRKWRQAGEAFPFPAPEVRGETLSNKVLCKSYVAAG